MDRVYSDVESFARHVCEQTGAKIEKLTKNVFTAEDGRVFWNFIEVIVRDKNNSLQNVYIKRYVDRSGCATDERLKRHAAEADIRPGGWDSSTTFRLAADKAVMEWKLRNISERSDDWIRCIPQMPN